MKSLFAMLLALLLLGGSAAFAEADDEDELIVIPLVAQALPIDYSGGCEPLSSGYDGDSLYSDPTLQVEITYHETGEFTQEMKSRTVGYWVADIVIGDASQLRTAAAESFRTGTVLPVDQIADRVNAVVAINGDFFGRHSDGYIIRQGEVLRNKLKGQRDVLMIDEDGDFHVFSLPGKETLSDTVNGKKIINAFYFGPILVENGEVPRRLPEFTFLKPDNYYARLAICQIDHLHYKLILTTTEGGPWLGLKLRDMAELCRREGARIAYNLDGGNSTTLYFNHKRLNQQNKVNYRDVSDILYFASSWNGGEQ